MEELQIGVLTKNELSKTDILDMVSNNEVTKHIFKLYRENGCEGHLYSIDFNSYSKPNGLLKNVYVFTIKDQIIDIVVPIFTSEKTTTWDFSYNKIIVDTLSELNLTESDITNKTKASIYYLDKVNKDTTFLSLINVKDYVNNGIIGKNQKSVYFWNDKLPNSWNINKSELKSEIFVKTLEFYNSVNLMKFCREYATTEHTKFSTQNDTRDSKSIIKNIGKGMYTQIKLYLQLKKDGYIVSMKWLDKDDLGIDIVLQQNGININIDVKSTSDDYLKISRFRKETDFYAIVTWDKTTPVLNGFINKYSFWQSKILGTDAPVLDSKTELYNKKITKKWSKSFLTVDKLSDNLQEYRSLKIKSKQQLFDI